MIFFSKKAVENFLNKEFIVTKLTDRMGMRIKGPIIENIKEKNIRSEGIVKGTIQIPPDGDPIIMLSDHGTIGGYPKIGVVISADYDKLVQLVPNTKIKFKLVNLSEAEKIYEIYRLETDNLIKPNKMNLIFKIPGPLLVFFGACSLSFGGLIVKSFEGATLWQILFWRSLFFIMVVFIFLLISYKKKIFRAFYNSGIPGIFGGIILSSGFCGYVFAMYNTTVANTNFIIQTQTIFLAIFGYFFLKEKISKITLVSIFLAISGIILMVGSDLEPGQMSGNLAAFIMPVSFAILILIIRKYPNVDMVPLQLYAGITAMIIGYIIAGKINISAHDIFLGFLAGFFQLGFGFILITIGARSTPSAMVGIIMLTEAVLGPFWAWLFINENSSFMVLIGGTIVIIAVLLQFYTSIKNENQTILNK